MELIYLQDNIACNHVRVCVFPERLNFHACLKKNQFYSKYTQENDEENINT
jgi:hypothetical protein